MHENVIPRALLPRVQQRLLNMPAVGIIGPRQCGKTTLAKQVLAQHQTALYLDLERPSDAGKLRDPEAFFAINANRLVCLDEIQRIPDLFPVMRGIMDERDTPGQFMILGSASPQLLKQSAESLAGRLGFLELMPFTAQEIPESELRELWLKGGFPRSFLCSDNTVSFEWRHDYLRAVLERDVPNLGFRIAPQSLSRFLQMCAHVQGQVLNQSKLAGSMGISQPTVRSYVDLLEQMFLLRVLPPLELNTKKRLVKSPKLFFRDSGLLHRMLDLLDHNDLLGHPVYGHSWEGFVIEQILATDTKWRPSFYRTSNQAEIDLVLERGRKRLAIECKSSMAPKVSRGFLNAMKDLETRDGFVIAPVAEPYPVGRNILVTPLVYFLRECLR